MNHVDECQIDMNEQHGAVLQRPLLDGSRENEKNRGLPRAFGGLVDMERSAERHSRAPGSDRAGGV